MKNSEKILLSVLGLVGLALFRKATSNETPEKNFVDEPRPVPYPRSRNPRSSFNGVKRREYLDRHHPVWGKTRREGYY